MTTHDILSSLFNHPNLKYTIVEIDGVTVLTYENMVVKMDKRHDDLFYMRVEVNGVRILTTTGKAEYVHRVLDDILDSCDLING